MEAIVKNSSSNIAYLSFDDIVFENRNKNYGSFDLRRRYMVSLLYAAIFSISAITIAVVCPLIYYRYFQYDRTVEFNPDDQFVITNVAEKPQEYVKPPDIPAPAISTPVAPAPVVVENIDTSSTIMMGTTSDIIETTNNRPPDILNVSKPDKGDEILPVEPIQTYTVPEEEALFMGGGLTVFHKWVQNKLVYPDEALRNNIFGRVMVEFTVGPKGLIDDIKIVKPVDEILDNEVIRVLKLSPAWSEPRQSGKAVKQKFTMPVFFQIQD